MLRRGLTAAGLVLAAVVLVAGGRAEPARTAAHSCSALDRQFLHEAALSAAAVALVGQDFQGGAISPKEAVEQMRQAELGIGLTAPRDPSLKLARVLMRGMYNEYGRAIRAQRKGGDAGHHMYRSYSYANYAHQVLSDAEPVLAKKGCSAAALL
jgi:hypothetical protein